MRTTREIELVDKFLRMWEAKTTSMADKARPQSTDIYVDPAHLARERALLFRTRPLVYCFSGELAEAGDFVCRELDGLPVVVIRGEDERLRALVNMCSHRGSRIYTADSGHVAGRGVSCPFHAWTYDLYGRLLGQPLARDGFAECDTDALSLRQLPVFERHGVVFVTPWDADGHDFTPVDETTVFGGADDDMQDLNLTSCRLLDSSTRTLALNWKLVIDTFLEAYHVFALHRNSLARRQLSAPCIAEDFGAGVMVAGIRKSIFDDQDKPLEERLFSPHATLQYILYPNTLISHQIDHIETWQVFPGASPNESIVTTSVYSEGEEPDERTEKYLRRSLEVLLAVTDGEDFPPVEQTQRALSAGGLNQFVFGRNEPGLIAYHQWLDDALNA